MLFFGIGCAAGAAAFWLLALSTSATLRGERIKAILPMLGNTLLIVGVLLATAVTRPDKLMWTGIGLAAGLMVNAVLKMLVALYRDAAKKRGRDE